MYEKAYKILKIDDYCIRLSRGSSQSGKYVQAPEQWKWAEELLRSILSDLKWDFEEVADEAAFYGPKIDIQLKNIYGREETASTVQLDFMSSERFDLYFINEYGNKERPYIIHRAPLGSHERMVAFLIEKHAGRFPFWLSPVQIHILPISDRHISEAFNLQKQFQQEMLRVEVDCRHESLGKKIADAQENKSALIIVIGDKEIARNTFQVKDLCGLNLPIKDWSIEEIKERLKIAKENRESPD